MKKLFLTLAVIMVMALLSAGYYFAPIVSAGSGFSAKNICSGHFLSGLSGQQVIDQALAPASGLLENTRFEIDEANRLVDASMWGLLERRAIYSDGTGCTLLPAGRQQLLERLDTPLPLQPDSELSWPEGSASVASNESLQTVIGQAFAEPDSQFPRNTKAVVVIHKGELVAEQYAPGIDTATPLIGWSMTKSVTNLLLGLLVADEALDLHQPAPVPEWRVHAGDQRAGITIDHLLRMSSGLEFEERYSMYSDVTRMLSAEADAGGFAAAKSLAQEPDSLWYYSSGTSNILAVIIKRSVGGGLQDTYDFVQQRLFSPLGISSARMETDYNGTFIGSSYMYASARDWARLGQLCLQNGRWRGEQLLPEHWIAYSTTPTPTNPKNNYGAHFWLNADPEDKRLQRTWPTLPADAYSMSGFQGQRVVIVPSQQLVVVRLGFSSGRKRAIEQLVSGLIEVLAEAL